MFRDFPPAAGTRGDILPSGAAKFPQGSTSGR